MNDKRTDVDFSKHEVVITKNDNILIHYLKQPNTTINSVKFINTNDVLVVTGDFGNWIFCREFIPSAKNYVSDHYWIEKLRISSCQDPYEFDCDEAKQQIKELLEDHEFSDEEKEWLNGSSESISK
jgi:hypothetical protein